MSLPVLSEMAISFFTVNFGSIEALFVMYFLVLKLNEYELQSFCGSCDKSDDGGMHLTGNSLRNRESFMLLLDGHLPTVLHSPISIGINCRQNKTMEQIILDWNKIDILENSQESSSSIEDFVLYRMIILDICSI